jgi:hypothetical protein
MPQEAVVCGLLYFMVFYPVVPKPNLSGGRCIAQIAEASFELA